MNNSNEFNSEPPVNLLPNFTNNLSNCTYHNQHNHRMNNQPNRYYMLANLSPNLMNNSSHSDDNAQPHNRINSTLISTRNNSRSNINSAVLSNYMSYLHQTASLDSETRQNNLVSSPTHTRLDFESNNDMNESSLGSNSFDTNLNQPLRILRNFNNDIQSRDNTNNNNQSGDTNTNLIQNSASVLKNEECSSSKYTAMISLENAILESSSNDLMYNWQSTKPTIRERISAMFNNEHKSDVFFIVGGQATTNKQHQDIACNTRRIPGHKFILALSSVVFDAMFYGPLRATQEMQIDEGSIQRESTSDDYSSTPTPPIEIQVPDVDPMAFLALLRYIYTDEVCIDPDSVMLILYAAKKYSVASLEKHCVDFLRTHLCSDNAFMLLTQARLFNEIQLANQCLDMIDKNAVDAFNADGFLDIDLETLCCVLDRDSLGIRETFLFQAVLRWANHHISKQQSLDNNKSIETTGNPLRELLAPALTLIRFPLMSKEDFAKYVAPTRMLTDREMVDMFVYYLTDRSTLTNESTSTAASDSMGSAEPSHSIRPEIPYRDTARCCFTGREQIINRYPVIEQRWGYSGTSDRIRFMVDRKIFVVGFGLYGCAQGPAEYQVLIEILQQESSAVLESNFLTFKCDGTNSIFNVRFKEPVEIHPNVNYIACATIKGPDSYYGSIGYQKVIHESATHGKVTFEFYYASGNNNGTSVEDGQIPQIIFYM